VVAALFGMNFRVVEGYGSASAVQLAMERGEVQGICQTVSSLRAWRPGWMEEGKMKVLFNMDRAPLTELRAPSIMQFAKTAEQRQILTLFSSSVELGRPIVAPPDTPLQRVNTLRLSFEQTLADNDLKEEAMRLKMEISLVKGEDLQTFVEDLMATPQDVLTKVQEMTRK
jgi:hypothetical protein